MKSYTSGELAKHVGVNGETIRYYERIGLLSPSNRRSSGYRIFTEQDARRLHFIRTTKTLGFSLKEIAGLLELIEEPSTKCDDMRDLAVRKVEEIEQKIAELHEINQRLRSLVDADCCAQDVHPTSCRSHPAVVQLNSKT